MKEIKVNYNILIALMFTFIYGYVNAIGFVAMNGMFFTFMSGNSIRLGVDIGRIETGITLKFFIIFICIILGVFIGDMIASLMSRNSLVILIGVEIILFFSTLILSLLYDSWEILLPLVVGIGIQNIINMRIGNSLIGKSFITGMVCNLGISLSKSIRREDNWKQPLIYLLNWFIFVMGASIATLVFNRTNLFISILLVTFILIGIMISLINLLKQERLAVTYIKVK